jgi:Uma2 family endonuclease
LEPRLGNRVVKVNCQAIEFAKRDECDNLWPMTAQLPISTSPQTAKLTARDFWLLADAGAFEGFVKTELIEGEIQVVNAVHSRHAKTHATLTGELGMALRRLDSSLILLSTPSTALSDDSIPEPDIAIASKAEGKAVSGADILLAVEISDTTLDYDLGRKMRLYARHGIPEYWVVDVDGKRILRHSGPGDDGYQVCDEVAFGAPLEAVTMAGLLVETARLG